MELYFPMAKRTKAKISTKKWTVPPSLRNCTPGHHPVLRMRPEVVRKRVEKVADSFSIDVLLAVTQLLSQGQSHLMLAHIDEPIYHQM